MVQFFRRIRQKLLNENQFTKYLIYAIGEIVLVMIGILLALQVNNWNEKKILRKSKEKLLLEMRNNLMEDLKDVEWNVNALTQRNEDKLLISKHLDNGLPYNQAIGNAYFRLRQGITFYKNTSAYESIKSIGFDLVSEDRLRSKITQLYSGQYGLVEKREDQLDSDIEINHFIPLITNNLITDLSSKTARPINRNQLSTNHHFREILKERFRRQNSLKDQFATIDNDANEIISIIEQKYLQND